MGEGRFAMTMRTVRLAAAAVLAAGAAAAPASAAAAADSYGGGRVVFSSTLVGSVPTDPTVHGVAPGQLPWAERAGSAQLSANGRLKVKIKGLVFTEGPFTGTAGPVTSVSASLYCGADSSGAVDTTATVALTSAGNGRIDEVLDVPDRCIAPTVLVHPFAATGFYIAATGIA
jgi:hypothetical protein